MKPGDFFDLIQRKAFQRSTLIAVRAKVPLLIVIDVGLADKTYTELETVKGPQDSVFFRPRQRKSTLTNRMWRHGP